jgi:hypothetical protein
MSFTYIKSAWAVGDILTSVQMNTLAGASGDITKALDKTGDSLASTPTGGITGAIDITSTGSMTARNSGGFSLVSITGSTGTLTIGNSLPTQIGYLNFATSGTITGTPQLAPTATLTLNGLLAFNTAILPASGSTYACDSGGQPDVYVLINTSTTAKTITLPVPSPGRVLYFKDISGNASVRNIVISHHASETIDTSGNYLMSTNWGASAVVCDGTNWHVMELTGTI